MNRQEQRMKLYDRVSQTSSKSTTRTYSTSFSLGVSLLGRDIRPHIHAIYGFVRLADEIVDSFFEHDQRRLFHRFAQQTIEAIDERISTNPILHAFQNTFHTFNLDLKNVQQFLQSMEWDLTRSRYQRSEYETYILGSAEVVGLMCLKVFVRGDQEAFEKLEAPARRLGAAFQKVNFLRDLKEDYLELGRTYFPDVDLTTFNDAVKKSIESEIEEDFQAALKGIVQLPRDARLGVYIAYKYFRNLLERIRKVSSHAIMDTRIRVPDVQKAVILAKAYTRHQLNLV